MNNRSCLYYLFSDFTTDKIFEEFAPISEEHSKSLFTNLFNNTIEQISNIENIEKILLSPDNLNPVISENLSPQFKQVKYSLDENNHEKLIELHAHDFGRNLILYPNTMGFSSKDIHRVFDLLLDEGNALVIGKTKDDRICFVGTNFLDIQFLKHLSASKFQFDALLKRIKRKNVNYFVLNGYLKIENLNDFKDLYSLLSNRISENFCTENIHENFTNLFIEYKELLQ